MRSTNTILDYQTEAGKHRKYTRVRLCLSSLIKSQLFSTEVLLGNQVVFLQPEVWLADWRPGDFEEFDFNDNYADSDFGVNQEISAALTFKSYHPASAVQQWYVKNLKNKRICIEVTDNCDEVLAYNSFKVGMKLTTDNEDGACVISLDLRRAAFISFENQINVDDFLNPIVVNDAPEAPAPTSRRIISTVECLL